MNLQDLVTSPLKRFFDTRIKPEDITSKELDTNVTPTTFRLPNDIKNYYQLMANASRNTLQGTILNVLGSVMNAHIYDNPARTYADKIRDRFFHMFNFAGISIRKIPQFLRDFGVHQADLTNSNKIVEIISNDKVVDFLAETLFFNKDWIVGDSDIPHPELKLYKHSWSVQSIIQNSPFNLRLIAVFDQDILKNPEEQSSRRYVHMALIENAQKNGVKYKRAFVLESSTWDYNKERDTIATVLEGIKYAAHQLGETSIFACDMATQEARYGQTNIIPDVLHTLDGIYDRTYRSDDLYGSASDFKEVLSILKSGLDKALKCEATHIKDLVRLKNKELRDFVGFYPSNYGYFNGHILPDEEFHKMSLLARETREERKTVDPYKKYPKYSATPISEDPIQI